MVDRSADDTAYADRPTLHDLLQPAREHLAFIIVFVVAAMLSALALTYVYSERYRAAATIFFRPAETTRLTQHSTQALGSPFPTNTAFKAVDQTIAQMLSTDALLREVVADLRLDTPEPRDVSGPWYVRYYKTTKYTLQDFSIDAWQILRWGRVIDDPVGGAVARLRSNLKVGSTDSYVYNLTVAAKTPELAKAIADDLGARLIDTLRRIDLRAANEREQRLRELRDDKGREVEDIAAQIRDLFTANDLASLPDELAEATRRASHFQTQQADTTADLRESEAKVAELTTKLRVLTPVAASAGYAGSPIAPGSRLSPSDYARLTSDKLDAQVRSRGLSAKLAAADRSSGAASARLHALGKAQAQYDFLSARLAAAKRSFAALSDAYEEVVIRSTTDQSQLHFQAAATAAPVPISPIKIYHVGAAGALALMIALGLAYVFDYFRIRLFLPPPGGERGRRRETARLPAEAPESAMARAVLD